MITNLGINSLTWWITSNIYTPNPIIIYINQQTVDTIKTIIPYLNR